MRAARVTNRMTGGLRPHDSGADAMRMQDDGGLRHGHAQVLPHASWLEFRAAPNTIRPRFDSGRRMRMDRPCAQG